MVSQRLYPFPFSFLFLFVFEHQKVMMTPYGSGKLKNIDFHMLILQLTMPLLFLAFYLTPITSFPVVFLWEIWYYYCPSVASNHNLLHLYHVLESPDTLTKIQGSKQQRGCVCSRTQYNSILTLLRSREMKTWKTMATIQFF